MKKAVLSFIVFVFCVSILYAQKWAGVKLNGEDEPLLEGTTWHLVSDERLTITYEFRALGRMIWRFSSSSGTTTTICTWSREGDIVKMVHGEGYWFSEGKYYPQTQRILMMKEGSNGNISDETLIPFQSSSIASTPSAPVQSNPPASSTNNIYVRPSTPTQSNTVPVPSTPTLQTGTYAASNSGTNMTMNFSGGIVTVNLNYRAIWMGTYRINGNQIIFSVTRVVNDDYASLRGLTFSYTINSSTSFSGNNETWVRTGL